MYRYIPGFESTIVLDNLYYQGYNPLPNIDKVYSYNTVSTILQNLATLHGAGLVLKQKLATQLSISYPFLNSADAYIQWRCHLFENKIEHSSGQISNWLEKNIPKFSYQILKIFTNEWKLKFGSLKNKCFCYIDWLSKSN